MKARLALLPLALALSLPAFAAAPKHEGPATIEEAIALAGKQHKPVLIDFQAVWCYSCYYMASHVLTGKEWKALDEKVVFVEADADDPNGQAWMKKLKVQFLPTYVALDEHGQELGRILAERTREKFYPEVAAILSGSAQLDHLKDEANKGSLSALASVLDTYQQRYAGDEGLAWFATLPATVRNVADQDKAVALARQQLVLLQAKAKKDNPAIVDSAQKILAGKIGCERPYVLDDLLGASAGTPDAAAIAKTQQAPTQAYVDAYVLNDKPTCADQRSGVLSLADVDAAAGDTTAEAAILERAISGTRARIGGKLGADRNLADNLRVYLVRAKRGDDVVKLDEQLIAAYPNDYVYAYRHGRYLLDQGQAAQALPFLEQASKKAYGANTLTVAGQRAKALTALGRKDEARKVVDVAVAAQQKEFPEQAAKLKATIQAP